jgi:hypothetical protein
MLPTSGLQIKITDSLLWGSLLNPHSALVSQMPTTSFRVLVAHEAGPTQPVVPPPPSSSLQHSMAINQVPSEPWDSLSGSPHKILLTPRPSVHPEVPLAPSTPACELVPAGSLLWAHLYLGRFYYSLSPIYHQRTHG